MQKYTKIIGNQEINSTKDFSLQDNSYFLPTFALKLITTNYANLY